MPRARRTIEEDSEDDIGPAPSQSSEPAGRRNASRSAGAAAANNSPPTLSSQRGLPQSSQSRQRDSRGRSQQAESDKDDRDDDGDNDDEDDEEEAAKPLKRGHLTKEEIKRKAAELVRYAVFTSHKKTPIRRADITGAVMKDAPAVQTNEVIEECRATLREIFGLDLVSMVDTSIDEDGRPAEGSGDGSSRGKGAGKAANPGGEPMEAERGVGRPPASKKIFALLNQLRCKEYDSIVHGDTAKRGFLMTVLAIITIQGQTISDSDLWVTLGMLGLARGREHPQLGDPEKLLNTELVRQLYVARKKSNAPKNANAMDSESSVSVYDYSWGPRANVEITMDKVLDYIALIYGISPEKLKSDLQPMEED